MTQPLKSQHNQSNDAVLKITRMLVAISKILVLMGLVALAIVLPVIVIFQDRIVEKMGTVFVEQPGLEVVGLIALVMLAGAIIMLLTLFALNRLGKIVDSVSEGNPFTRINGTRLRGMGIAVAAIQIVTLVGGLLTTGLLTMLGEVKPDQDFHITIDGGISLNGILLFLLLIILARVFDRGAEMREELEGTI